MKQSKTKKPFYKRWWFITIAIIIFLGIITPDTPSENPEKAENPTEENTEETVESNVMVDLPQLINSSPEAAESLLGPGDRQYYELHGDISWLTEEYYIEAHYENGTANYVFFSIDKDGASREDVFEAANISFDAENYSIEVQEWLDQAKAKSMNSVEIAGIHMRSK